MADHVVPRDVLSMQVNSQPSTGAAPPQPYYSMGRTDGFRPENMRTAQSAFRMYEPGLNPPSRQSSTQPYKTKTRKLKFVNNKLSEKKSPRPQSAQMSPSPQDSTPEHDRPAKRRRLNGSRLVKTILTTRRPLRNSDDVHRDIWRDILSYCDPRFLLEAKTVDRLMYDILSSTTNIWRRSRELHLPEAPPCPSRLSEQQYLDLLIGRACQVPQCVRKGVTSVAWPFLGRLCLGCLHEKTLKADEIPVERQYMVGDKRLVLALPMGHSLSGRHLKSPALEADGEYREKRGNLVLKSEFEELEAEYLEVASQNDEDALKKWFDMKRSDTKQHMLEIQAIEKTPTSQESRHGPVNGRSITRSDARRNLFVEEAAKLNPPISEKALNCTSAYHRALKTGNAPTARAWETLKPKIVPFREQAERLANLGNQPLTWPFDPDDPYRRLVERRKRRLQQPKIFFPEQEFVLQLGKQEFEKCLKEDVADCDLLLLTLKNVFDRYDKFNDASRPVGVNYNSIEGPYALSFDDADMIIHEVMEPAIRKDSSRGQAVFTSLRCIGCAKTGYNRFHDFKKGMEHVYRDHSSRVGEGEEYWQYTKYFVQYDRYSGFSHNKFPWYSTPWSRCLPLIPNTGKPASSQIWHPDNDWKYVRLDTSGARSAFEGRWAKEYDSANGDFLEAVKHAVGALQGVKLTTQAVTRIALQYAIELSERRQSKQCTLEEFVGFLPALREVNPALNFKFMCGICLTDEANAFPGVHVKHTITMKALYTHWQKKHIMADINWHRLLHLPSNYKLLEQMTASDKRLQKEKDEVMAFAAQEEPDLKKRANRKARAILGTRLAMTAFEQLFPRITEARGVTAVAAR